MNVLWVYQIIEETAHAGGKQGSAKSVIKGASPETFHIIFLTIRRQSDDEGE